MRDSGNIGIRLRWIVAGLLLVSAHLASAHHSIASTFTSERTTQVSGEITRFRFVNPHVLIYLEVADGQVGQTEWVAEGSAATGWRRSGWDKDTLRVGDQVRIVGDATIDGSPMVWIDQIEYLDRQTGEVLAVLTDRTDPAVAFAEGQSSVDTRDRLEGENLFIPTHLDNGLPNFTGTTAQNPLLHGPPWINDPPLPYTEAGERARDAWDVTQDPQVFCEPPGLVRQAGYTPYGQKIQQFPDRVEIEYEEYGSIRTVYFADELPTAGPRSHLGDSVARYEGDSLVIETVNLLPNASGHFGNPLSGDLQVIEVFRRADDDRYGSQLQTEMTVRDSTFLTETWTISRTTRYLDGYEFLENNCEPPIRESGTN